MIALLSLFSTNLAPKAFADDINLSWSPNSEPDLAGYNVYFRISSGSYGPPTSVGNRTSHIIPGLFNGTYFFAVTAIDTSGNESGFSTEVSKTITTVDTNSPVISSINAGSTTASGTTISWTTNEVSDSQIEYGNSASYEFLTTLDTSIVTSHSQSISGLLSGTTYHYRVLSRDAFGNLGTSGDNTFTTSFSSLSEVTNLSVESGLSYEVVKNGLSNGVLVYIDRTYTYDGIPSFLSGTTFIKTANDDKTSNSSSFLTFDINQDSTLYIAHDDRITPKPAWLLSFADTGQHVIISSQTHSLWKKDFPAGSVILGGNEGSGNSMYTVIVFEKGTSSSDTTPPSDTIAPSDTTAPMDISNFTAVGSDRKISLSWTNPIDLDFVGVRIMYRTDGFPTDINDGTLLGDISGDPNQEMTIIHDGLSNGLTYYYLAATYDDSGNFQTTVFVSAIPTGPAAVEGGNDGSVSGGGCGMIRPGGGEPPSPGDAAAMLTTIGLLFLMAFKKTYSKIKRFIAESHRNEIILIPQ